MKLTALLILVACLHVAARTSGQTVTLSVKDAPMKTVFREIQKQTGLSIMIKESLLENAGKVTLDVKDMPVQDVIALCLKNQALSYSMEDGGIVIKPSPLPPAKDQSSLPPPVDIHGRITDSTGAPLYGVSVMVKGTKKGTTTDLNGNFFIHDVSPEALLNISSVGYESQDLKIDGKTEFSIRMKTVVGSLLDVVVNKGYYNTTRRFNTGDVSVVKAKVIEEQPVSNFLAAMEGRVPGLYIQQTSGIPGSSFNVILRGQNSIQNGNDPLYIVDGVPFISSFSTGEIRAGGASQSPFNSINPGDIENVEVLKDADATAIYGSRGANGVILITTKIGKSGETKFNINVSQGFGRITKDMDLLNTQQYLAMRNEAFRNDGKIPGSVDYDINGAWDTTRYTDWQKLLIGGTSHYTNAQASVSGGTSNTRFLISGAYNRETTVLPGDYANQRGSMHVNLSHNSVNNRFQCGFSAFYSYQDNRLPASDLTGSISLAPDAPNIYDSAGKLNWQNSTWNNPFSKLLLKSQSTISNLNANFNLSYELFSGFKVSSDFGYNNILATTDLQTPLASFNPANTSALASSQLANSGTNSWIIEPQLNYSKQLGKGHLDILLGVRLFNQVQNSLVITGTGFESDELLNNLQAASKISINSVGYSKYRYNSLLGRINYNLMDKYIINLTGSRDGSSRFGPNNQFANFGALGLAWIFSKENIFQDKLSFLSFGKLRASYGITGNDQIGDYNYLNTYATIQNPYQNVVPLYPVRLNNGDYAWETNKKFEVGLDFGFNKDRILFSVSYYQNRSSNQLVNYSLPDITGFPSITANLPAVVQNTGFEFDLTANFIKKKDFNWTAVFNLSIPQNELISFPGLATSSYSTNYVEGKSLFIQKSYQYTGVDPSTGIYTFRDFDKDGKISSPNDRQLAVFRGQKYYGGLQNSFIYKGIELDVFIQFVNQTGSSYMRNFNMPGGFGDLANQPVSVLKNWQKTGDLSKNQKFSQDYNSNAYTAWYNAAMYSDFGITDASFIRLKNISLQYNLPVAWMKKIKTQNCKIFIQCQNLATITSYEGVDPENQGALPPLKTMTAGFQLVF